MKKHLLIILSVMLQYACMDSDGLSGISLSSSRYPWEEQNIIEGGDSVGSMILSSYNLYMPEYSEIDHFIEPEFEINLSNGYRPVYLVCVLLASGENEYGVYLEEPANCGTVSGYNRWNGNTRFKIYRPGAFRIEFNVVVVNEETNKLYRVTADKTFDFIMEYPDADDVFEALESDMDNCWDYTKTGNCEYGFAAYLNDNIIEVGNIVYGDEMICPETSGEHITATVEIDIYDYSVNPTQEGGSYFISIFHTHPPITNCNDNVWRKPGPSSYDEDAYDDLRIVVPAFVYDYDTNKLNGGHNVSMSAKVYRYGVEARDYNNDYEFYSGEY
ncbi:MULTISPECIES: hypothetical protein [Bacteroides]|uniref:hypothetical protein n=1 Tax=Bacteroides TaxID=816 RepID=UPI00319E9D64